MEDDHRLQPSTTNGCCYSPRRRTLQTQHALSAKKMAGCVKIALLCRCCRETKEKRNSVFSCAWKDLTPLYNTPALYLTSAIRLSALPARNHSSCVAFMVWFNMNVSLEPFLCFTSHFTGLPGARSLRPRSEILSSDLILS